MNKIPEDEEPTEKTLDEPDFIEIHKEEYEKIKESSILRKFKPKE